MVISKRERLVAIILFAALTSSVGWYSMGVYRQQMRGMTSIFKGRWSIEAMAILFLISLIGLTFKSQSWSVRALLALLAIWFITISAQAFHSIPPFHSVLVIGGIVEVAAIAILLRGYRSNNN
jgi:hypothetical protein